MNDKQLVHYLDRIAAQEIPDEMNKWPEIQARLTLRRTPSRRTMRTVRRAAAALIVVLAGLVGYAFSQGPSDDPGLEHVREAGLLQPLHLTETHDGVTVTLTEGYADANRIALWLTIETGEQPAVVWTLDPILGYANGDALNVGFTMAPLEESDSGMWQMLINFDPVSPLPDDQPIDLRLTLKAGGRTVPVVPEGATLEPGSIPPQYLVDVPPIAPFVFTFRLNVQEALTLGMTLEQVTLAPSQIALRLCFDLPDGGDWQPQVQVRVDGAAGMLAGYRLIERPHPSDTRRCADYEMMVGYTPESKTLEVSIDRLQTSESISPESLARAQERLAAQGIALEFEAGRGHFSWKILSAPEGMSEQAINEHVSAALSEQYEGPWSFIVTLPAGG
jgi:hypothetical protein